MTEISEKIESFQESFNMAAVNNIPLEAQKNLNMSDIKENETTHTKNTNHIKISLNQILTIKDNFNQENKEFTIEM